VTMAVVITVRELARSTNTHINCVVLIFGKLRYLVTLGP